MTWSGSTAQQNAGEINQIIRVELVYPLAPEVQKNVVVCNPIDPPDSNGSGACDPNSWLQALFGCPQDPGENPVECTVESRLVPDPRYPPAIRVRFGTDAQGPIVLDPGDPPDSWPKGKIFQESRCFLTAFLALVCGTNVPLGDAEFDEHDGAQTMLTRVQMRCVWARRLAVSAYQDIYRLPWRIRDLAKPDFELLFAWNPRPCRNSRHPQPIFPSQPATVSQAMYASALPKTKLEDKFWGVDLGAQDSNGVAGGSQYIWFWQNPPPLPATETPDDSLNKSVWPAYPEEDAQVYHFYTVWDANPFENFTESLEAEVQWARMRQGMGLPHLGFPQNWTMMDGFEAVLLLAMSRPFLTPTKTYDDQTFQAQLGDAWLNVAPGGGAPPMDFATGPIPTFQRITSYNLRFGGSPVIGQYVQALLRVMNIPARLFPATTVVREALECRDAIVHLFNGVDVPATVELNARDISPTVTSAPNPARLDGGVAPRFMLCVPPLDCAVDADDLRGESGFRYVVAQRDLGLAVADYVALWKAAGSENWSYLASAAGQKGARRKALAAATGFALNGANDDNWALRNTVLPIGGGTDASSFDTAAFTRAACLGWAQQHQQHVAAALLQPGDLYLQALVADSRRLLYSTWLRTPQTSGSIRPVHFMPQNFSTDAFFALAAGGGNGWPVDPKPGSDGLPFLQAPNSPPRTWLDQDQMPWDFVGSAIDLFADRVLQTP